ncbi:M43 family zinc metalloprotease [Chryseolinea soli]|nr:M43 family zinc metalloprotease [Chryseolinea soli]
MIRRVLFIAACTLASWHAAKAQSIRQCATMEQDSINKLKYPWRSSFDDLEQLIQQTLQQEARNPSNGRTEDIVITIPIIVHVVHKGEAIGTGRNLSQAQIQSQIAVLNEDFRRKVGSNGYSSDPRSADIEIEFCLAPVDQQGNPMAEPGIDRIANTQDTWTRTQIEAFKPQTIWNPSKYYNVWTLKFGGEDANLLGYAQFPDKSGLSGISDGGSASTDGVVIQYTSFGSAQKGNFPIMAEPYNKGRTLSHETGHWLGLRHIWGDGVCADDYVSDTPPAKGPSRGCPVTTLACDNSGPIMPQNYMDYSDDACMNIFTKGQKDRIRAVLVNSPRRKALYELGSLCTPIDPTAPPTVSFFADRTTCVLREAKVQFTSIATNFPTDYRWYFEGGTPDSSRAANPTIQYNVGGVYRVALVARNSKGYGDTLNIDQYIHVSNEGVCGSLTNFDPAYTPSVLNAADFGSNTGYLTGTNSSKNKAYSERFANVCGYAYVSGAKIKFASLADAPDDATITVTIYNALGYQGGPGAVLERKDVLLKQVKDDIANNRYTEVVLDRETPAAFGKPFHVGVEINNDAGYKLAIVSSANNEANNSTSWVQDATGEWRLMTIAYGANIAMDIEPIVGINPSVQISASKLLINPGEQVILNGRGATIFSWDSNDNVIHNVLGPQLVVNPTKTTTYTVNGSGLELCNATADQTVYVEGVTAVEKALETSIQVHPNPGTAVLNLTIDNDYVGDITLRMQSVLGQDVNPPQRLVKDNATLQTSLDTSLWPSGLYLMSIQMGQHSVLKKWIKK